MATSLSFLIHSRYDGDGIRQARRDIDDFDSSITRSGAGLNSWSTRLVLAAKATAVFAPALVPISAALLKIGASATTMAATVGVSLAAYGLAMKNAIDTTNGMAKAGKALSDAQKDFIKSQDAFNKAYSHFGEGSRDVLIKTAALALQGMTNVLKGMEPIVKAIAPEVLKVAEAFKKWTEGDSFKNYVNLIKAAAVPALRDLVAAGKDVLNVLGDGFRAFLPHSTALAKSIREGAASLREWSDAGGFQKFLAYVKENSGPVKEFFKALWDALKNIGEAFKLLGPFALGLTTTILQLVAALPPEWIALIVKGFVAWRTAMLGLAIISTVVTAVRALSAAWFVLNLAFSASAIGLVVLAIAALVAGIILLIKNWDTVSAALATAWNATWNGMKIAVEAVWNALKIGWAAFSGAFVTAWQAVSAAFVTAWNATWNGIKIAVEAVWNALKIAWEAVVQGFSTAWTAVSTALVTAWNAVWNGMKIAVEAVWNALKTAWEAVVNAFSTVWTTVSTALKTAWDMFWNGLKLVVVTIWDALTTAWTAFVQGLSTAWTAVSTALTTAWNAVWNAIKVAAETVWNALKIAWDAFINGLQTIWTTVSTALSAAWSAFWTALQTAASAIWTAMQAAWQAFITALQTIWTTVSTALQAAWSAFWTALQTAAQTIWTALQTAWSAFWTAMTAAWDAFKNAMTTAWNAFWEAIKTAANTVWEALKTAWTAFFSAMTTAWNTFKDAITVAWKAFWDAIKAAAQAVWDALKTAWSAFFTAMTTAWNTFKDALTTAWKTFWEAIQAAAKAVWEAIQKLWDGLLKGVTDAWEKFSSAIKTAWKATWDALADVAKSVWGTIGGIIEKAVNGVITVINMLIKGFNNVASFLKISVHIDPIDSVKFPGLADGGVVNFRYGGMTGGPANLKNGGTIPGYAPGRDTVPAMLSKGEGVLTPEAVRGLGGPSFVNGANRQYAGHRGAGKGGPQFGTFAGGGMVQHFAVGGMTAAALAKAGVSLGMVTQGEYSTGVAASAGTHDGGGVVDIGSTSAGVVAALRAAGFAAWARGPAEGMVPHIHAVLMNHPDLSAAARAQVESFKNGGNGLGVGGGGGGGGIPDFIQKIIGNAVEIITKVSQGLPLGNLLDGLLGGSDKDDGGGLFGTGIGPDIGPDLTPGDNIGDAVGDLVPGARLGANLIADLAPDLVGVGSKLLGLLPPNAFTDGFKWVTDKFSDVGFDGFGDFGKILADMGKKALDGVTSFFTAKNEENKAAAMSAFAVAGSGNVQSWAGQAAEALKRAGLDAGQLNAFLALMSAESGGNPNAVNRTDSNAIAGMPSQGLMQVIPPTFATYRDKSLPNNILDPMANMVAAANYIKAKYGGKVPGSPYADGTASATPGLHLVGEAGPELITGPTMGVFGGGETVHNATDTASILGGSSATGALPTSTAGATDGESLAEAIEGKSFEDIGKQAEEMAKIVKEAWDAILNAARQSWADMIPTMTEVTTSFGADVPASLETMRLSNQLTWADMNLQSATQWALMRDTTFAEAELHQMTTMPLAATTMTTAYNLAWTTMTLTSTTEWTAIRDTVFIPFEEHMQVTMVTAANEMNTGVSAAFTSMGETLTTVLDAGIAKMDEFIAKAQEAIAVTAELVAAVAEAQAAMASMAAAGAAGGAAGGTAGAGVSGNVESWRPLALEAMAAGGLDPSQIDAFLALMQAESGGDPNAINNWDSNAAAGTPSIGLMQVIQPTFDAHNVTGGDIHDPYANMAASAAYIKSRYGGQVPGSPYASGTNSATPGWHLVGENGPELVGLNGAEMAEFSGGQSVMSAGPTQSLIVALSQTIVSIDAFIAKVNEGIKKANEMTAAAKARAATGAGGGPGAIGGTLAEALARAGNPPIIQGPFSTSVGASAGTHAGDGVVDVPLEYLGAMIAAGFAAWARTGPGWEGNEHVHAVQLGNPGLSPQAAWQAEDWARGGSGLGIPAMAKGGIADRGWTWVGERGAELVNFRGGERVKSHRKSMRMVRGTLGEGGRGGDINIHFHGPTTEEAVRRAETSLAPKLRSMLQQGVGARMG
jgi:SLT domain-containing protein